MKKSEIIKGFYDLVQIDKLIIKGYTVCTHVHSERISFSIWPKVSGDGIIEIDITRGKVEVIENIRMTDEQEETILTAVREWLES